MKQTLCTKGSSVGVQMKTKERMNKKREDCDL